MKTIEKPPSSYMNFFLFRVLNFCFFFFIKKKEKKVLVTIDYITI